MKRKIGVVLFQLGGPDSLEAVEPFLYNLFSDPDIIDFPFAKLAREPLARLMAMNRARKVGKDYDLIGGKSPLQELTLLQAEALEKEITKTLPARVVVAMRYWHPSTEEAIRELEEEWLDGLVLLPLYPQYSRTTTRSSLNEWERRFSRAQLNRESALPVSVIRQFYNDPLYLDALVEHINRGLEKFRKKDRLHLVFSAHGIPCRSVEAGDPYEEQTQATVRLVMDRGGWRYPHTLCYQSRVGPGKWLTPFLGQTLHRLGTNGVKQIFVVPISFVSDHIETLKEINIEGREEAEKVGIEEFEMMPALNSSPVFMKALAGLVLGAVREPAPTALTASGA